MKRAIAALAVGAVLVGGSIRAGAQSGRSALEGVWQVQELSFAKSPAYPVNKPVGTLIFAGSHYSLMYVGNSARPAGGVAGWEETATAEQIRAVWGPFTANAGTFQVSGDTLNMRPSVAKNPGAMTSDNLLEHTFTLNGDTLVLTATKNRNRPVANPFTLRLTRAK
jgi:hypothetical protein